MSFRSGSFAIHKTKQRRVLSRSPLQLSAAEQANEFGPKYDTIDARVGNQKVKYNIEQGCWQPDGMVGLPVGTREMTKLEKTKRELEEDNDNLRAKVEVLLEMLAEVTAECEMGHSN